jgi:hypothetical protein
MTIATPNRDRQLACIMNWLFVGIVIASVVCVGFYNSTVEMRRAVSRKAKAVEVLKLEGAELKNSFYAVLDTPTLVAAAERLGYVKDNTPSYVSFAADGSATFGGSSVSLRP